MSASANITPFLQGLAAKSEAAQKAAVRAVDQYGEKVLGDAQELCPVDTGFLIGSATSQPAELEGQGVTKKIGFGAEYAIFGHENLNAKPPQGQAKFLSTGIERNKPGFDAFVGAAVQAAMERGG